MMGLAAPCLLVRGGGGGLGQNVIAHF